MTAEAPRSDAQELPTAPRSPQVDPGATVDANGPQIANLGTAEIHALLEALLDDEYGEQGWNDLGSLRRIARVLNVRVAARIDAALAPVRELVDDFRSEIDWSAGRNTYGDNEAWQAAADRLAAVVFRQEQARD